SNITLIYIDTVRGTLPKMIVLLVLLGLLSYLNATTFDPMIFIFTSLIIGFLKMMVTIELFLPLMAMIGNRGMFYGAFYTFVGGSLLCSGSFHSI
ncbi:MAG: hypothetical protein WCJ72_07080, partial [Chryseobacterium sp.]